ncbi:uncharacterized protein LOC127006470 [Eriocheir sinensis]|uniref:uncharacterized protein LOC127006470 n=1 Tax=Eriocheir sinensis TaxID=95602 RepID=UPI0021C86E93|nr:uncharacterized protein LOC127006470 [Eriocheir sinensis]
MVGDPGAGVSPAKVTLTLQLRGGCWRTTSRKVAVFSFQEASGHASAQALLDLEYLFRCSSKPGAGVMQVKICVALRCGGKRVARADLGEFLGQLTRGGRLDSFLLYIHEEKVALLQANQPIPYPATEWLFEGEPRGTHTNTSIKAEADEETYDIDELEDKYKEGKAYLEEVFSVEDEDEVEEVEDSSDDKYKEWKAYLEEVFSVEDDAHQAVNEATPELREVSGNDIENLKDYNDDSNKEWQTYPEKEFSVKDGENEAADEATSELREASDEGNEAAYEATSEVKKAAQNGTMTTDEEVPHQGESSAPATVSVTPSTVAYAYRSLAVAHRFIDRLAGPEDRHLEDLRRSYGVEITRIKRTLHVKGHRDAVLQCHHSMRAKIAEWRKCEVAEAH